MAEARVVRVEGIDQPCLLICEHGELPEELVIDFRKAGGRFGGGERTEPVTLRLQPSSLGEREPVYVEIFDD